MTLTCLCITTQMRWRERMTGYGPTTLQGLAERLHRVTRRGCARPWDVSTRNPVKYCADRDGVNPEEWPLAAEMSEMSKDIMEPL